METATKTDIQGILVKLAKLQSDVEMLKQKEEILGQQQKKKFTVIDESMAEIWDNEEDAIWDEY